MDYRAIRSAIVRTGLKNKNVVEALKSEFPDLSEMKFSRALRRGTTDYDRRVIAATQKYIYELERRKK